MTDTTKIKVKVPRIIFVDFLYKFLNGVPYFVVARCLHKWEIAPGDYFTSSGEIPITDLIDLESVFLEEVFSELEKLPYSEVFAVLNNMRVFIGEKKNATN